MTGFQDLQKHSVWYDYGHKALGLGILYLMNKGIAGACKRARIAFPSPLIGEACRETKHTLHTPCRGLGRDLGLRRAEVTGLLHNAHCCCREMVDLLYADPCATVREGCRWLQDVTQHAESWAHMRMSSTTPLSLMHMTAPCAFFAIWALLTDDASHESHDPAVCFCSLQRRGDTMLGIFGMTDCVSALLSAQECL